MAKRPKTRTASDVSRSTSGLQRLEKWKLEDAKELGLRKIPLIREPDTGREEIFP